MPRVSFPSSTWLLFILFISANVASQETIRLTTGEWQPYLSEELKHQGFIARIVKSAFAQQGIEVEYGFFPWRRSFKLSQEGDWDGSFAWYSSEIRAETHYYSDAFFPVKTYLFHLKERPLSWESLSDLYGLNLGLLADRFISRQFEQAENTKKINVVRPSHYKFLFKQLINSRIDAICVEVELGYAIMQQVLSASQFSQITHNPKAFTVEGLHVLFSKKAKNSLRMRTAFNKGLQQLKASGIYDKHIAEAQHSMHIRQARENSEPGDQN